MTIKRLGCWLPWLLGLLSGPWVCAAELTWAITELTIKADPKKPTAEVVYPFKNTSDQAIVIKSVAPSCDCVQPLLAKEQFAPGEAGELRAVFTLGSRTGRQQKLIVVSFLDAAISPAVLSLTVDIPEAPVRLSTDTLRWKQGRAATEQVVEITLTDPEHTTIDSVQCAEASFAVSLEQSKGTGGRRIVVKPLSTEKLAQAMIRIQATVNGVPQVLLVQLAVR